jgi:hypothetical protein
LLAVAQLQRGEGACQFDAAPEGLLGREQKMLIDRIDINPDLDPLAAAGDDW